MLWSIIETQWWENHFDDQIIIIDKKNVNLNLNECGNIYIISSIW